MMNLGDEAHILNIKTSYTPTMTIIEDIIPRKIIDSRGNPTIEIEVFTISGGYGRFGAPSGASTGKHEVVAFPKGGVDASIEFLEEKVIPELIGHDAMDQRFIDTMIKEIDGTPNLSNIGGNAAVALSIANAKAAANAVGIPLYAYVGGMLAKEIPKPLGNVLGGGKHAVGGTTIQEFLVATMSDDVVKNVITNAKVHKRVGKKLKEKIGGAIGVGDERAWVAAIGDKEAIEIVHSAAEEISSEEDVEIKIGIDFAASSYYKNGKYIYRDMELSPEEQIEFVESLVDEYGVFILEDPLHEEDFEGFAELTKRIGMKALVVGDDLFVTNVERIMRGIEMGAANAVLIKPNQIGTLSDTYDAVKLARENGYSTIISHRSGETEDPAIAHLGVAFGCEFIKTGTIGGERTAKLNELIRIQEVL